MNDIKFKTLKTKNITEQDMSDIYNSGLLSLYDSLKYFIKEGNSGSVKLLFDNDELVAGVLYHNQDGDVTVHYIEVSDFERSLGYGSILIKRLIKSTNANLLDGLIENSYNAFCFWSKVANSLDCEIPLDDEDVYLLNDESYDLELSFEFNLKK